MDSNETPDRRIDGNPGTAESPEEMEPPEAAESPETPGHGAGPEGSGDGADQPTERPEDAPRSGLRNPAGALRGAGAGVLAIEALVLLLAIQPLRVLGGQLSGWGIGAMVALAALCCVLAGLLKHRWAWYVGAVLQILVIVTGVAQWAIGVIGLAFAGIWLYVLHLRRTILGRI